MNAVNLLTQLNELGIKIAARDGELKISAPPGALTADLRDQLARHKTELLELLDSAQRDSSAAEHRFVVPENSGPAPLSFGQERLWFLDALDPGLSVYNIPLAVRLHGELDVSALAMALHDLIDRHESLRTNFVADADDQPRQVIHDFLAHAIDSIDLSDESEEELQSKLTELHRQPFNLAEGPLLRTHLLRRGEQEHVLLFVIHHIISDAWSLDVLFRELVTLYEGHRRDRPVTLPTLTVQYADYALWQREWLNGPQMERQLGFWKQQLADAPGVLELPTDRPRPPVQTFNGARILRVLPKTIADRLNALASDSHATLFMVLLAACDVLLSRWSGQDNVVIGTPVAGRQHTELENLIGFFINTLPLRADLSDNPDFRTHLNRVRQTALDAFDNQSLPFEKLVEELQPERDQSHSPIYQVVFMLQNAPAGGDMFSGLTASGISFDYGTTKFDLNIAAAELEDGLGIEFEYNTDLFDAATIERMAEHYAVLLEGIVANPDAALIDLPLMREAERTLILEDWNATAADYSREATLISLFEAQVAKTPDTIALCFGGQTLSYAQLNQRANQLGHYLREQGTAPDSLVGIYMERSIEMVVAIYGILKAGGAYVPLDPDYPEQRLEHMLHDAGIEVVLTHAHLADRLSAVDENRNNQVSGLKQIALDRDWDDITAGQNKGTDNPAPLANANHAAYVIFTSGSTGRPKGVLNEHRGICNRLLWMQAEYQLNHDDCVIQKTPFSFDVSVWEFFWPLLNGARLVIAEAGGHRDSDYLCQLIQAHDVSTIHFVPSMLETFLHNPAAADCRSLQRIICSGEALSNDVRARCLDILHAELHNLYGPTEAAIDVTYWDCQQDHRGSSVPIGHPVANTQIYIVDSADRPVPIGVPGELLIGGVQVARGYVNQPELTAERFQDNPFGHAGRIYRSGDLARFRPDGSIEFLGRIDFQVKLRGFRIELGEIEAELLHHPRVTQAVVIMREDTPNDQRLVAYVVGEATATELAEHLGASLPDYMVPAAFLTLDALPLTANGKLDRRALPAPDWRTLATTEYTAPRSPVEATLAEIWQDLLNIEQVGIHDDFFALGGHSLLATRVAARIRRELGKAIKLRALFANPTIAQLAGLIDDAATASLAQRIPRREQADLVPLSFAQQRLWILNEIDPGGAVYNIPWAISFAGDVNRTALQQAVNELAARHESIRTVFIQHESQPEPVQKIAGSIDVPVQLLQTVHSKEQAIQIQTLARQGFDLSKGPLLRVYLIECNNADTVLLINVHHIIADGWSLDVINRELSELYDAELNNRPAELPELPIQYADYSVWQRDWLASGELDRQLGFWREQLTSAQTVLELPTDHPRPPVQTFNGANAYSQIAVAETTALKALAKQHNGTLYMALLAAFNILLHRYTGQDDILIGSPIAGREQNELENLIGVFINTLVLRTRLNGDDTFVDLLEQTRETTLGVYENQALPFERLVEDLHPERDVSRSPLFQVMFILQNAPFDSMHFADLATQPVDFSIGTAKFDLTLTAWENDNGLGLQFEYNTDLFDAGTIESMFGHFQTLIGGILTTPNTAIRELPVLGEAEKQTLLVDRNVTTSDYDRHATLHSFIETQAENYPDTLALVSKLESLNYFELNRRANALAAHLTECDVGPDALVGVCTLRDPNMVVALLAILKAGGAYVPLDPSYPQERISYMLKDSGASVLLTHSSLLESLPAQSVTTICLDDFDFDIDFESESGPGPIPNPVCSIGGEHLAYVIYTSGSTGQPKGVAIEHRSVVNFLQSMLKEPGITSDDRLLAVTTLSFDISILEIFGPLIAGATVVLASRETATDGYALANEIDSSYATIMQATPATWQMLLQSGWRGSAGLKILCGGEALELQLANQLLVRGKVLWNMYGPTETTIWSTCSQVNHNQGSIDIGKPIANTSCYVVDSYDNLVPAGVTGELLIGGDGLARGYLNRPELSAEKFVANPFGEPHEKLYRTGDLVRYKPDGALECLGRIDNQVKLRGFRIELGEIESLLNQHETVNQARVIVREDQPGDKRLVAYAVPEADAIDVATLRDFAQQHLPGHMVPQAIVELAEIPLTPNGKFDRKALPAPDEHATVTAEYVAPESKQEQYLATVWQELLGIEKIGIRDDFFDLGGHSLLAMRVTAQIRSELHKDIELLTLFLNPTIEKLAEQIEETESTRGSVAIPRRQIGSTIPLSFAQQRLWILDEIDPDSSVYNIPWAVTLDKDINRDALEEAINELIARHESLRTSFVRGDTEPMQIIAADIRVPLEVFSTENKQRRRATIEQLANQSFDLSKPPLARFHLIDCKDAEPVLLINIHHIISDVWSLDIINRELGALYNARLSNTVAGLPVLPIQYADFAVWQRDWLMAGELDKQLDYWRNQLQGTSGILELPTDRPHPATQTFNGARVLRNLSKPQLHGLERLSRESGATLYMTLFAAFQALLYRYTGQSDIVVGTPIAGREHQELDNVIGFFINTLALRTEIDGAAGFNQLLDQVRQKTLGAYAHQSLPFEKLVEELQPDRDTSRSPIFQVMFILQNAPFQAAEFEQFSSQQVEFDIKTTKFELTLTAWEHPDGLGLQFEYNTDLFDTATIERLAAHYSMLLDAICAAPATAVADLPLLEESERKTVVYDWNNTQLDFGSRATVDQLVKSQVDRTPDETAIRFETSTLSYAELDRRANVLASSIVAAGVKAGERIAICCPRCLELPIAALAAVKSGGCYVAIDPNYPHERIATMLSDSQASIVLTHSDVDLPPIDAVMAARVATIEVDKFDFDTAIEPPIAGPAAPSDPLYCIYTSGSTGKPKGVQLSQAGLANLILWQLQHPRLAIPAKTLQFASFSFDVSFQEMFSTWCGGGELVMISDELRQDLPALAEYIAESRIERLFLPFAALQPLAESWEAARTVPALIDVVVAGEQLKITQAVRGLFSRLSGAALHNHYGPSETHVVTALTLGGKTDDWPILPSIGRPVANTRCYVLDEQQQPTPVGVPGELYIGGTQVALGYLNRDELNAEKFIASPFVANDRLYRTGDKVRYLPDGNLEFLGRIDDQFKWRGYRIEPGEIETVLSAHSGVQNAVVVLREDDPGEIRLVAYVTRAGAADLKLAELDSAVSQSLPEYMHPSTIVILDAMPLTPSGKLARRSLPAPAYTRDLETPYVGPGTPTETALADIWQQLLNVGKVSIHDNFFSLGGHSLTAIRMVLQIREQTGATIEVRDLFAEPTIARFAKLIDAAPQTDRDMRSIVRIDRNQPIPLSSAQQRLWFLARLDNDSSVYNVSGAVRLNGDLDITSLQDALDQIVARHETLRATFANSDAGPVQIIHENYPVSIHRHATGELSTEELYKTIAELVNVPFDLESGPLLRLDLLELAENSQVMVIGMHHIISDGWSINVFNRELATLYAANIAGTATNLEPLPVQYADYAAWQQQRLSGDRLQTLVDYWGELLRNAPPTLDLPTDRPRPAMQSFAGASYSTMLDKQKLVALRDLAVNNDASLFMVLVTAFNILLARWTNQQDIVIGTPVAGRERSELEGLIGVFINTLPIRTLLTNNPDFTALLHQVRSTVLECFAHQSLPFQKMVEELQPERNLGVSPIFQTMFVLQNAPEPGLHIQAIDIQEIELPSTTTKFDLTLASWEAENGLGLFFEYNMDLFDAATIKRMAGHFETLLTAIVEAPDTKIDALPLLTRLQREEQLNESRAEETDFGRSECIHQLFESAVVNRPDAIAVVHNGTELSYGELNAQANRVAHYLIDEGVTPDTLVGLCVERSLDMVIAILGILKSGGAYVPLDPVYPADRLSFMLEDSSTRIIICQRDTIDLVPEYHGIIATMEDITSREDLGNDNPRTAIRPDNLAYVIYTSGSTGKPKGALIEHRNVTRLLAATDTWFGFDAKDVWTLFHSYAFDFTVWELWGSLTYGGKLVIVDYLTSRSPDDFYQLLIDEKVTVLNQTPSAFNELIRVDAQRDSADLSLRYIIFGGEALDPMALKPWVAQHGDEQPQLINMYGITETTVHVTYRRLKTDDCDLPTSNIGLPIPDLSVYLLDRQLEPVPNGLPGELFIGGAGLARGYLNRSELTADRFILHSFDGATKVRLYRTGDIARRLANGDLDYMGRSDDQVKVRGFRIELGEIEAVLNKHESAATVRVIIREDTPGNKMLVAYVVPEHDSIDVATLRAHAQASLPNYMLPQAMVTLDAIPLTPNGKLDQKALPAPGSGTTAGEAYAAPTSDIEIALAQIWQQLLNVEQVGLHDDFFALGGHSLLTIRLITEINAATGEQLSIADVFEQPTIAELAALFPANTTFAIDISPATTRGNIIRRGLGAIAGWFGRKTG